MYKTIEPVAGTYAICQFDGNDTLPDEPADAVFWSVTRAPQEVSLVCEERFAPTNAIRVDVGWRVFRIAATMDLGAVGVLAALLSPLRDAQISSLTISTFHTDYVLVRAEKLPAAFRCLAAAGYQVADSVVD